MRRRSIFDLLRGLLLAFPVGLVCSGGCADPGAPVALTLLAPEGLLDRATSVELAVFSPGDSKCLPEGHVDVPGGEGTQRFTLGKTDCASGVDFCKTIQLDRDGSTKMFAVTAKNAGGILAEGCASRAIDQDPIDVTIDVKRFNPPACCGDAQVQTGEQCEASAPPGNAAMCPGIETTAICGADCKAAELLLSIDNVSSPPLDNGDAGTKHDLALSFGTGAAAYPNALRAAFVDSTPGATGAKGGSDVHMRLLTQDLYPITNPPALANQLNLPMRCAALTGQGLPRAQRSPALAAVGDTMAVVYAGDDDVSGIFDIYLSPQIPDGCMDAHKCMTDAECPITGKCKNSYCATSVRLTGDGPAPGADHPSIAVGPAQTALVVWTRANNVYGRIWKADGTLVPASEFVIAVGATNARAAGSLEGFQVVYESGQGIYVRRVSPTAKVSQSQQVNQVTNGPQDQPDIATLEDGRTMIVWHGGSDIYFQRYDADGMAVAKDQDAPLNTTTDGDQQHPTVKAAINVGNFYTVAWETVDNAEIRARFVGGTSGFAFNSVTGQTDDFSAGHPGIAGARHAPALAIGGNGYVVIGWQDDSPDHHGVYLRRFPLPPTE